MAIPFVAAAAIGLAILVNLTWFNWITDALSDLGMYGNVGAVALVYNVGIIVIGVVILFFALGLIWVFNKEFEEYYRLLAMLGALILASSGLVLMSLGILTKDFGSLHNFVAIVFFAHLPFAMGGIGITMLFKKDLRLFGALGIIIGLAIAVTWFIYYNQNVITGIAMPELISILFICLWLFVQGYRVYRLEIQ